MSRDIIVSKAKTGGYKATQNGRKVAEGPTQNAAAWKAQKEKPNAPIIAQRVRTTAEGVPDEFRRIHPHPPAKSPKKR